jgi:branched-chain amino acid transport system permease protein
LHYYLGFALLYGVILATYLLIRSRVGFYLRAIRDDPEAAEAMGVDTVRWKLFAFTASAFIAGVAGAFYGQYVSSVTPSLGVISEMGLVVAMTVIGGAGTILGPVLGGLLVQGASQYLREYEALRLILFGLFIIMIMRFFPSGLMGVLGLLSRRLTLLRVSLGARVGLGGPPLSSSGRSTGHPRWAFRRRNKTGLRDAANH